MPKTITTTDYRVGKYVYKLDLESTLEINLANNESWARIGPDYYSTEDSSDQGKLIACSYIIEVQGTDALTRKGACKIGDYQLLYFVEEDGRQWMALWHSEDESFGKCSGEDRLAEAKIECGKLFLHRVVKREYAE